MEPTLARLGGELRRIREDAGLSGSEVARAIGWSQPKVSRVETGRFGASLNELATLLDFYGVPQELRAELLAQTARMDGLEGSWVVRAGGTPRRQTEVSSVEGTARLVRQYQATTVPGLLQTRRYAEAVAEAMGFADPGSIAARRLRRQASFYSRSAVTYQVVLDERALLRWSGGEAVMVEQLEHLLSFKGAPIDLRLLSTGARAKALAVSSFLLYDFEAAPSVVLLESETADTYLSDDQSVTAYSERFARLQADSLSMRASRLHLQRTLRKLRGGDEKGK